MQVIRGEGYTGGPAQSRAGARGPAVFRAQGAGKRSMKYFAAILILILIPGIPAASAGEVTLSTPQGSYYFPAGGEGAIPLTLASTYGQDITGNLQQSMTRLDPGTNGSHDTIVRSRAFSAFTEERTVALPVGRSDVPADYLLTIVFRYNEDGARTATLGGIRVHFVTSMEGTQDGGGTLTGSDTADPVAGTPPAGAAPARNPPAQSPAAALQNTQMMQDTSALRNQMAEESNRSELEGNELLGFVMADPLVVARARSLAGAGFALNDTGVTPASSRSGSFVLTYASGPKTAAIRGAVREARVLFAEESSDVPVPLPGGADGECDVPGIRDPGCRERVRPRRDPDQRDDREGEHRSPLHRCPKPRGLPARGDRERVGDDG